MGICLKIFGFNKMERLHIMIDKLGIFRMLFSQIDGLGVDNS